MKNKKKSKLNKGKVWFAIKLVIMIVVLILSIYCTYVVHSLDMLPKKIFIIFIVVYLILNILNIIGLLVKKKALNIIAIILSIILLVVSILGIKHGNNIANFMNSAFNNDGIEITEYNIAVLKSSDYNNVKDLDGKVVAFSIVDEKKEDYVDALNKIVNAELKAYDNSMQLYDDLISKKIDAIIVTDGYMQILEDEYSDVEDKIKIIYNFEMQKEVEVIPEEKVEELKSVNILISGSDSRSGKIVDKTQSDVNMIVTINPKTHKILLTSIPRDYYVQLHGTTGLKDKLTNSGVYGINKTKTTIEDLFDIKINYTVKVGFQSVIKVVDIVGGVDINSDTAFVSHCDDGGAESVKVKVGMNHFNGAQALSYA